MHVVKGKEPLTEISDKIVEILAALHDLNAGTLDGLDSSDFVQIAGTQTITGAKTFTITPTVNGNIIFHEGNFGDTEHGDLGGGSLHAAATVSVNGFMSAADKTKLDGVEVNATDDLSAAEILALLLTVDGPGSGLNADLLDGLHASDFLQLIGGGQVVEGDFKIEGGIEIEDGAAGIFRFNNATWGGRVARIMASNIGDFVFRVTSAPDVDDGDKDFRYSNANDRWEVDDELKIGVLLTSQGTANFLGQVIVNDDATGRMQFNNGGWGGRAGRIIVGTGGSWTFRPASAPDTDIAAHDFRYNNTLDKWEVLHDLRVGNLVDFAESLVVGNPTDGHKGTGSINARDVYDDGVLLCLPIEDAIDGSFDEATWRRLAPNGGVDVYKAMKARGRNPASAQSFVDELVERKALPGYWNKAEWDAAPRTSIAERMERLLLANDLQALAIKDLLEQVNVLRARLDVLEGL